MSLDLSWSLLDSELSNSLLGSLNSALQSAKRPDFLGPIVLESFHFGTEAPDVELVGIEDVWTEFLNADGEDAANAAAPGGVPRDSTPASGATSARMSPSNTRADTQGAGAGVGGLHGTMHRVDPRDDHLARFAEATLPFGGDHHGNGGAHPAKIHTFRQYSPSDIQSVHFPRGPGGGGVAGNGNWEADSVASFPMSGWMTPSIAGGWTGATGLRAAAAGSASGAGGGTAGSLPGGVAAGGPAGPGGYFAPWQAHAPFLPAPHHRPHPSQGGGAAAAWRRKSHGRHLGHGHVTGNPSRRSSDDLHDPLGSGGGGPSGEGQNSGGDGGIPSLQLRFSVLWSTTSLRLTLTTSLLINHPSPGFMSLPLTITLTGLALQSGLVVAFENDDRGPNGSGSKRRVHLSLVEDEYDDEDDEETHESHDESSQAQLDEDGEPIVGLAPPFGATGTNGAGAQTTRRRSGAYTPQNPSPLGSAGGSAPGPAHSRNPSLANLNGAARRGGGRDPLRPPPSVGERLLPHLSLESSVGQADKHVLRNVGKVERFVMELIRKAVVDELVFPNFYSVDIER